jgi:cob(I)alamin adenosyltransferase
LRERNTTTLKEMQDNAFSVEANLLIKRSKIKAEERKKIEKEQLKSLEVKLDILTITMKEMMQKVIMRNELVVQGHHVPLVIEK